MVDRRQGVKLARINNPCATLQEIGDKFDISRERVRQILKSEELPTKNVSHGIKNICPQCGNEFPRWPKKIHCSRKCYEQSTQIELACDECGILFTRNTKLFIICLNEREYVHTFCGKQCQGKWLARMHGFGANGNSGYLLGLAALKKLRKNPSWNMMVAKKIRESRKRNKAKIVL